MINGDLQRVNERVDELGMLSIEEVVGYAVKKTLSEFVKSFEPLYEVVEHVRSEVKSCGVCEVLKCSTDSQLLSSSVAIALVL